MNQPKTKRRASILRRITLMSWLVAVLSLSIFALFITFHLRLTRESELEDQSYLLAQKIEHGIAQHMEERSFGPVVTNCLALLEGDPGLLYIIVRMQSGGTLTHYRDAAGDARWSDAEPGEGAVEPDPGANDNVAVAPDTLTGRVWHHSHTASEGANIVGSISLGMSMQEYDDSIRAIYRNAGTTGAVVLIIGVIAAYSVARNLIRPLRALQSFAYTVTGGALNARADVNVAGEIGDLAESMNRMVESLEQSNFKIRDSMKSQASLRE